MDLTGLTCSWRAWRHNSTIGTSRQLAHLGIQLADAGNSEGAVAVAHYAGP